MKVLKLLIVIILFTGCTKPESIGIADLQEIVKKRDLQLVEYKYHDMVFLHKKDNPNKKLRMIVKYPVSISAKVDLKQIEIDTAKKQITLPEPTLDPANIFIEKAEFISIRNGLMMSFGGSRADLLESLKARTQESTERISKNAKDLGILDQAKEEATSFVEDLLSYFNLEGQYKIAFKENTPAEVESETPITSTEEANPSVDSRTLRAAPNDLGEFEEYLIEVDGTLETLTEQ